jgi:hypothetical protein
VYKGGFKEGKYQAKFEDGTPDGCENPEDQVYKDEFKEGKTTEVRNYTKDHLQQTSNGGEKQAKATRTRRGHRGGKKKTISIMEHASVESHVQDSSVCANLSDISIPTHPPESSMGGHTSCVVCFADDKTHMPVPCGHISVCGACASKMDKCPYCREEATMWIRARVV